MLKPRSGLKITAAVFCTLIWSRPATAQTKADTAWLTAATSGIRIWNPSPSAEETVQWFGAKETATGSGIAVWLINDVPSEQAAGEWHEGRLHGHAVWHHRSGARYEGLWSNGRKHGSGVYTWPDGKRFCGVYREGRRQHGAFYLNNGKPIDAAVPSAAIRKLAFDAETSAIQARKAATLARVRYRTED